MASCIFHSGSFPFDKNDDSDDDGMGVYNGVQSVHLVTGGKRFAAFFELYGETESVHFAH
jgi:hypothetical protein